MDYNEIKQLIDDMGSSKLDSLQIEFPDGIKISMTKKENETVKIVNVEEKESVHEVSIEEKQTKEDTTEYKVIKSPMVGTFYESSSPKAEAFVKVGDKVKKGQVLCIVEAMKLMNEIESEFDGEIAEVCVKNEDVVEFGAPLFRIK